MAWINSGDIGDLREIHNWMNRPVWPQYTNLPSASTPVPKCFDWDLWLGPHFREGATLLRGPRQIFVNNPVHE
jgi:hypothetical protein